MVAEPGVFSCSLPTQKVARIFLSLRWRGLLFHAFGRPQPEKGAEQHLGAHGSWLSSGILKE